MEGVVPYYVEELSEADRSEVRQHFPAGSNSRDLVRLRDTQTGAYLSTVNRSFTWHHHLVWGFQLRPDDVWVVTYPKCGTTWTQEIAWNLMHGVQIERISEHIRKRSPFIDIPMISNYTLKQAEEFFAEVAAQPSPRLIKTHHPFQLLPPALLDTCKVLFVSRNVLDACVSYYHHHTLLDYYKFDSSFESFADLFRRDNILRGGYFPMLKSGWDRSHHPNMMMFTFEEMKKDPRVLLERIMKHIGYTVDDEKLDKLCKATEFNAFQKKSGSNTAAGRIPGKGLFIRKGIVGDWENHFSQEQLAEYTVWIEQNLDKIGIRRNFFDHK